MSRDTRYLLLFAACAALIYSQTQQSSEKKPTADVSRHAEPNLLPANPGAAYALRPVPSRGNGVYYQHDGERRVRPASANMALVAPLAAHAVGQVSLSISNVSQAEYRWSRGDLPIIPLLSNKPVTLHVAGFAKQPDKGELKLHINNALQPEPKSSFKDGVLSVPLTLAPSPTVQEIKLVHAGRTDSIRLRAPSLGLGDRPKLTDSSSNRYADPVVIGATTNVYDRYLRVKGQSVQPGTPLVFHLFAVQGSVREFWGKADLENPPVKIADNRVWDAELRLPDVPAAGKSYQLIVLTTTRNADRHNVSQEFDTKPHRLTITGTDPAILRRPPAFEVQTDSRQGDVAFVGKRTFTVKGTTPVETAARVAVFFAGVEAPLSISNQPAAGKGWEAQVTVPEDGVFQLQAATVLGNTIGARSTPVEVRVGTQGPRVIGVEPANLAYSRAGRTVTVQFDPRVPIDGSTVKNDAFVLTNSTEVVSYKKEPAFNPTENSVTVEFDETLAANNYTFTVKSGKVKDKFGNTLQADHKTPLFKPVGGDTPTVSRGISGHTGPNVEFQEYTKPRKIIDGFNASDHVETRVSRLYYYRDAHRVAQIINREAKSYNRAAVDMQQQLADKARQTADQATDARRAKERKAIEAARKTREAEQEQQQAEQTAQAAAREVNNARNRQVRVDDQNGIEQRDQDMQTAERIAASARAKAQAARVKVQQLREAEAQASEESLAAAATEDRARENQFRREVAAAHADPDTYAPGRPDSQDPVRQVSVSVIGEGLLQLRGPMKGINIIRTMINQMDAPVGQVRVGVHTVQINGEKGDRMEVVAGKIQRYIDHSRFLTLQSAEMFRKAIVQVAAQKATELGQVPGLTQDQRDRSYLHSFFGEDFINELDAMDSEFLHTGNKLLSLHSMDSTSLASAMFIMALAKNTTRMQILRTFEGMMASELPMAEQNYFEAGLTCDGKERLFNKHCKPEDFQMLSQNARFESIRGMFNAEFASDDTMTPIQREFVRLAQIFKSRLIVEMELKQRIMERSVIEERLGNHQQELEEARTKEKAAQSALQSAQKRKITSQRKVLLALQRIQSVIDKHSEDEKELSKWNREVTDKFAGQEAERDRPGNTEDQRLDAYKGFHTIAAEFETKLRAAKAYEHDILDILGQFVELTNGREEIPPYANLKVRTEAILGEMLELMAMRGEKLRVISNEMRHLAADLSSVTVSVREVYQRWLEIEELIRRLNDDRTFRRRVTGFDDLPAIPAGTAVLPILRFDAETDEVRKVFGVLLEGELEYRFALEEADGARRPLDHKKFLDMLVDEMEDKYIELLEGTRAHTANLDAYIKRLMTSLDDDFNTQFYYPTFRKVREASQMWDVQMGQVETTTVLANNRAFAKVSPQATMEFDLPKRDILIAEAMDGAKAMVQDFGALAQDPTFLAMAKLGSGQPTATQSGGASGGQSTVRNVLPGMSTDSAESVMSQQGPGGSQFGAALEGLIPDPAIYKFETGTGWEIRPVIQPDGQALVFHFNYMYSTNIREPVRPDEKHLGRIKRHYVDTDVQLSNFELREISRYTVALKASRTSRGVPLFEDIPLVGVLFRPQPSDESSLQQNIILGQSTIFPTLFDLMGLRWAPVVADLDPLRLSNDEFVVRNRRRTLMNRVFDQSSSKVDEFLRIPEGERRMDLYRSQETLPTIHPDGYQGPGAGLRDSQLREGYTPTDRPESQFVPGEAREGSQRLPNRRRQPAPLRDVPLIPPQLPGTLDRSSFRAQPRSATRPVGERRSTVQPAKYVTSRPARSEGNPRLRLQRLPPTNSVSRPHPQTVPAPVRR